MQPVELERAARSVILGWPDGSRSEYHYIWLRDNCRCPGCLHPLTLERQLFTADIPREIEPAALALAADGSLEVRWAQDGHHSRYPGGWLREHRYPAPDAATPAPRLWGAELGGRLPVAEHAEITGSEAGLLAFLERFRDYGFTLVRGVPAVPGEVERFANHLAYVREIIFGRVHEVYSDADAYNVASTEIELKPHTDLPSYRWPPSVQLLHCLEHEARGGESIVVDGFRIATDLREQDPAAFELLARTAVPFRLYAEDSETFARAPMIQLDEAGALRTFRFSNQLLQPVDLPGELVEPFYDAYRRLSRMVVDPANQVRFRLRAGDLIAVHSHRVMHGRAAFDPASGGRHLQDVYMEFDDLLGRIRLLRRRLHGAGAERGDEAKRAARRERAGADQ